MYKFNWDAFTEADFANYCAMVENDMVGHGDYFGCVRVGNLCFDMTARDYEDTGDVVLTYDLYVGGINVGGIMETGTEPYGWSKIVDDYPYEYAEGSDFEDSMIAFRYDELREIAEKAMAEYIENCAYTEKFDLVSKALQPLNVW